MRLLILFVLGTARPTVSLASAARAAEHDPVPNLYLLTAWIITFCVMLAFALGRKS